MKLVYFILCLVFLLSSCMGEFLPVTHVPEDHRSKILRYNDYVIKQNNLPVDLKIYAGSEEQDKKGFIKGVKIWNKAWAKKGHDTPLFIISGETDAEYGFDGQNVLYSKGFAKDNLRKEQQAMNSHLYNNYGVVKDSDIIINTFNFFHFFSLREREQDASKLNFISLVVHELGHCLGLAHEPNDEGNIMYPYLGFGQVRVNISKSIISAVESIYLPPP